MAARYIFLVLSVIYVLDSVHGHGMVLEPPNRSSMWRYGFPTPLNYQDNENFCGGFHTQHEIYGGKCGICGDNYGQARPRDNEDGGKYGLGIVGRTYHSGANIQAIVRITASHMGKFEFSLCNLDLEEESEECFAKYPLERLGSEEYNIDRVADYSEYLKLPEGLTCERCVLRWTYTAGNNWGVCEDGTGALGCGAQETFRTCSDIRIVPHESKQLHDKNDETLEKSALNRINNLLIKKFNSLRKK